MFSQFCLKKFQVLATTSISKRAIILTNSCYDKARTRRTGIAKVEETEQQRKDKIFLTKDIPYPKYNKKEREFLTNGLLNAAVIIPEDNYKKPPEVDPNEEPYSHIYEDNKESVHFTQVEVITKKDPNRWFWVERLLPKDLDIATFTEAYGKECPSGYVPPPKVPPNLPYFVNRTRTGIFPVYKHITKEDRVLTILRQIDGDIWELEETLRFFLENETSKKLSASVDETEGFITFDGDYVFLVVDWLKKTGF